MLYNFVKSFGLSLLICICIGYCQFANFSLPPSKLALPSSTDAQKIISAVDIRSAKQLLISLNESYFRNENLIPNDICQKHNLFVNQMIGLINIGIWRNIIRGGQAAILVGDLKQLIEELSSEIRSVEEKYDETFEIEKNLNIDGKLYQLQMTYRTLQQFSGNISQIVVTIEANSKRLEQIMADSDQRKAIITDQSLQLELTQKQIKKMEENLSILKDKEQKLKIVIRDEQNIVASNDFNVNTLKQENQELENKIHSLSLEQQQINKKALELQFQIPKIQQLIDYQIKARNSLALQLQQLQNELNQARSSFNNTQKPVELNLKNIELYKLLDEYLPFSTKLRVRCFADPNPQNYDIQQLSHIIVGEVLFLYIRNYISNMVILPQEIPRTKYNFMYVDLFGIQWTEKFGYPFDDEDFEAQDSLLLKGDPTCWKTNFLNFSADNGVIVHLNSRQIFVRNQKNKYIKLLLGACTRIDSENPIPEMGDTIYFKGLSQQKNKNENWVSWNAFSILCYQ